MPAATHAPIRPTPPPVHAEFLPLGACLHVRIHEPQRLDRAAALFRTVWSEAASLRQARVLLDLRDSAGQLRPDERAEAGQLASWGLRGLRVALLLAPGTVREGRMTSAAARQGLACRSFFDEGEALAWLAAGPPQPVRRASAST